MTDKKGALFVCLGNICRSPIAEAVFLKQISDLGIRDQWLVDSAATTDEHEGKRPDHRALDTMKKHSLPYDNRARPLTPQDYNKFDYIFGMDDWNIRDLKQDAPKGSKAKILLLGDFDPQGERIIRDPYYDRGSEGFEKAYEQCMRCCENFLKKVQNNEI